jgi:hypothetical protein
VYEAGRVDTAAMLEAITKTGFSGEVIEPPEVTAHQSVQVDVTAGPDLLRAAFARAKEQGRLVLVSIHGPG